jgi:hypothetical protein
MTRLVVLVALTLAAAIARAVPAAEPTARDDALRQARLDALEAKVRALQAARAEPWLTRARRAEVEALVADVLADADTRASGLDASATGGWDDGFFIGSADGAFRLEIGGYLQVRFVANRQNDSPVDDTRTGFENRRTKLFVTGHVVDPSWRYRVGLDISRRGGGASLSDAWIGKRLSERWRVRAGQYKPPFLREALVSASRLLAVERSLVNRQFRQGRSQGVSVTYRDERLSVEAMFHDGFGGRNEPALVEDTEYAITARAEVCAAGSWARQRDFSSWGEETLAVLVGAAIHYEREEYGTPSGPEEETISWTVDAGVKHGGANAYAAVIGRHLDVADADQLGLIVQGGLFVVPSAWEVFARYEYGDLDTSGVEDLHVITAGVTRYWLKHAVKWTTDVGLGLEEVSDAWASDALGWRADEPGEDGQIVLRSQLQLRF